MNPDPHEQALSHEELAAAHHPEAIRERLKSNNHVSYLKDFVYGAIDGAVTTFAVVSGVAGAGLSPSIVIVLGVANLVGDGFSMAVGNFLGTRSEGQQRDRIRRLEERHIAHYPDGEREEIRQIFQDHGFQGKDLDRVVDVITADHDRWVETMLKEEHGLPLSVASPLRAAGTTFLAFFIIGSLPLIPFLLGLAFPIPSPFAWSTGLTLAAFFSVGAIKSRFIEEHWARSGTETTVMGSVAAALAYLCGLFLRGLIP